MSAKARLIILSLIIGILLGHISTLLAQDRNVEYIWNRVWNTTSNTIKIIGQ